MRCCYAILLSLAFPALAAPPVQRGGNMPTFVLETGGHTDKVTQILFAPNGRELISAGWDQTIRVWDIASQTTTKVLRLPKGPAHMFRVMAVSPDGQRLAVNGTAQKG